MSQFERGQRTYYLDEMNRSLPATSSFDQSALERALQLDDPMVPGGRSAPSVQLLSNYGLNSSSIQRDTACRSMASPVGMRDPAARTGCGWWFTPNPSAISSGAYGARHGPMSPTLDTTYGSGRWIWDPEEAGQAEGAKQAAKIQSCPDIQFSKYPNIGWCPSTNMAIVTDGAGNPLYPQMAGGDCPGGGIVTMAQNCPPPAPPPSSSSGPSVPSGVSGACSTNPLTPGCFQAMLPYVGCSPNGALGLALSSGSYPAQFQPFNDANTALVQRGFTIDSNVVSGGNTTISTAFSSLMGLQRQAAAGIKSALNICNNAAIDYCPGPGDTQTAATPFPLSCIAKAGIAMGYPPSSPILQSTSAPYWAQIQNYSTWQSVLDGLTYWMEDAKQSGINGLWDVYGITVTVPPLPYLAYWTPFSLRPVAHPSSLLSINLLDSTGSGALVSSAPDNTAAAIANVNAGNMTGAARSLYSQNLINLSTFIISAGNNQVGNYVSIQSSQYPGVFLRHSNFQLWTQQNPGGDDQFNSDSSFQIVPQGGGVLLFQSYNYPAQTIVYGDDGQQLVLRATDVGANNTFFAVAPLTA